MNLDIVKRITIFLFSIMLTYLPLLAACNSDEAGYAGDHIKDITIQENSGNDLNNYQVLVELDSTNFDFSQANSTGSDVRFYSGVQELSHWIEEWNASLEQAKVWVEVGLIPASGSTTITMWAGDPQAASTSDGEATFEFFDDFDGTSIDDTKWTVETGSEGGYVEVRNGMIKIVSTNASSSDWARINSRATFDIDTMFVAKRMKVTTGSDSRGPMQRQGFRGNGGNWILHKTEFSNESWVCWALYNDGNEYSPYQNWTDVGVAEGTWYESGVAWYEENGDRSVAWYKNGVRDSNMDYSSNVYVPDTPQWIWLLSASYTTSEDNTGYMWVDRAYVRKFVAPEPSVTVTAANETPEISFTPGGSAAPEETEIPTSTTQLLGDLSSILEKARDIDSISYDTTSSNMGLPTTITKVWMKTKPVTKWKSETTSEGQTLTCIVDHEAQEAYMYVDWMNTASRLDITDYPESPIEDTNQAIEESIAAYESTAVYEEIYDGKECVVVEYSDEDVSSKLWIWKEYGFPLKVETNTPHGKWIIENKNIDFSDIPDSIFELPPGVYMVELPT